MPIGLRGGYGGSGGSGLSGSVGEGAQQLVAAEGGHLPLRSSNPHWMILQFVLLVASGYSPWATQPPWRM